MGHTGWTASIKKAKKFQASSFFRVLFAYIFSWLFLSDPRLSSLTYLPPCELILVRIFFVSFCLVPQKPVAVQNTLLLCCCFYHCAADAATVRCPTVRRPFLVPSARAEMNFNSLQKRRARDFLLLLFILSFLEWGEKKEFWTPSLPTHNLVCIALQTGQRERVSLQYPVPTDSTVSVIKMSRGVCKRENEEK